MSSTHSRTVSVAIVVPAILILTSVAGPPWPARAEAVFEVVGRVSSTMGVFPHRDAKLTLGSDGNIYGSGASAGDHLGMVFRIDGAGTFSTVHTFGVEKYEALVSRLVRGDDGAVYGTVNLGLGSFRDPTSFFRIENGVTTILYSSFPYPVSVVSDLVLGSDGAFYASLAGDGCVFGNCVGGNIFKIDRAGNFFLVTADNPERPPIPSIVGSDGAIYGTWGSGAFPSLGHIFRLDTAGNYTVVHGFNGLVEGFASDLVLGSDGLIYAAAPSGGAHSVGTIIRLDTAGNFTLLHSFTYDDGANPNARLTVGSDGALYGFTTSGGSGRGGTVFRVDLAGAVTTVHSFLTASDPYPGPDQALSLASDGALWGSSFFSDNSGYKGRAFRIDSAGTFTSLLFPTNLPLGSTRTPLVEGSDCALYGVVDATVGTALVYRVFEAGHLCQRIDFAPLGDRTLGDPAFTVSAAASSGLPVSFSASGRCALSGDQVRLKRGVGACRVTASQAGDSRFEPAEDVTQEFRVRPPRRMRNFR